MLQYVNRQMAATDLLAFRDALNVLEDQLGGLAPVRPESLFFCWREKYAERTPAWKLSHSKDNDQPEVTDVARLEDLQWIARLTSLSYDAETREDLKHGLGEFCTDVPAWLAGGDSLGNLVVRTAATSVMGAGSADRVQGGEWEVLAQNFAARSGSPAHFVAINKQARAAVLCVRGTHEFADAVTDIDLKTERLRWKSNRWFARLSMSEQETAHSGMARSAQGLLDLYGEKLKSLSREGYRVTLMGHSLGAGTAAILASQLQGSLPFVQAYCFATPSCVTSGLARKTAPYVTSVVLDDDIIPRAGVHSIMQLHNELVAVDARLPQLTNAMVAEVVRSYSGAGKDVLEALLRERDARAAKESEVNESQLAAKREIPSEKFRLVVPGRIIHLHRTPPGGMEEDAKDGAFSVRAVEAETSFFNSLVLSPSMVSDHSLDSHIAALREAAIRAAKVVN